jgi:hypothetical protein
MSSNNKTKTAATKSQVNNQPPQQYVKLGNFNFESPQPQSLSNVDMNNMYSLEDIERDILRRSDTPPVQQENRISKADKNFNSQQAFSFLNSAFQHVIHSNNYKQYTTD